LALGKVVKLPKVFFFYYYYFLSFWSPSSTAKNQATLTRKREKKRKKEKPKLNFLLTEINPKKKRKKETSSFLSLFDAITLTNAILFLFYYFLFPPSSRFPLFIVSFSSAVDHAIADTYLGKPFIKDGSETMREVTIERFMTGHSSLPTPHRKKTRGNEKEI
jgi:hypothetical protein